MILLYSLLCLADPWNRPQHFRIVMQSPKSWKSLWKDRYKHRFWWDNTTEKAEIQWLSPKGWKTIKKKAAPGWISAHLPIGSRFRIRFSSSTRWSDMTQASPWVSAHTIQRIFDEDQCPLITSLTDSENSLWGGAKDGGLYHLQNPQKPMYMGTWEGLWDDRVISIDGENDRLLIGTAGGAILFSGRKPVQSWREELLHPYVQATSVQDDDLWIGGFRGLYRVRGGEFEIKRREHSVFSITSFSFGETLIGYDGLLYNTQKDDEISFSSWGNIYDSVSVDNTIWLASDRLGVVSITDQIRTTHDKETPNSLFWSKGIWMGGKKGLYIPQQGWTDQFGEVFDIHEFDKKIWLATQKGIFYYKDQEFQYASCSPKISNRGTLYSTPTGVIIQDKKEQLRLGSLPEIDWTKSEQGWHPVSLSGAWRDIKFDGKRAWSVDQQGIWVHMKKSKLMYPQNDIKEIAISNLSIWGRTHDDQLVRHTLGKKEEYDIPKIQSMSSGKDSICVATEKGLYRIKSKAKDVQKWYPNNSILAVHSTQNGDCWFISDSEQVGVIYANGDELQWDAPNRLGKIYDIQVHKKGIWIYSSKGLWLMRKRVP